jgi:hypothetical protein
MYCEGAGRANVLYWPGRVSTAQEIAMAHAHAVRRIVGLAALTAALLLLAIPAASAGSKTFVSLGFVFPPPYYYYPPPAYYYPPLAYYYPPPAYYYPPPVVYVRPAPIVAQPTSPPYVRDGQTCREYQTTVSIAGVAQPSYGTACLQPDGAWRIVN